MEYIYLLAGWFMGLIIGSFCLIPVAIILFFGIPFTKKLTKEGSLSKDNPIIKNYLKSVLILLLVFGLVTWGASYLSQPIFIGYAVGLGTTLLFGLGKSGSNRANMSDYLETNKRYFING